jgi:Nif-specific regulatory protein
MAAAFMGRRACSAEIRIVRGAIPTVVLQIVASYSCNIRKNVSNNTSYRGLSPRAASTLVEASAAINASLNLGDVLQAIAHKAAAVLQSEASSVLLLDKRRKKLVFMAAVGDRGSSLIGEEFDADLGIAGKVAASGKPIIVPDVRQCKEFFRGIDAKSSFQTRGLIAAPLIRKDEVIGVVEVLNKLTGSPYDEDDLTLLQIFANLAASGAHNAAEHETVVRENRGLRESLRVKTPIIGNSAALRQVTDMVNRVAGSNATVLLLGETGTGKELAARQIHNASPRSDRPFIAINCAALPETLLESELFGHEKGAFTGAHADKMGRFELAHGGSLFLDEIGDISLSTQIKLLRVLQEREFVRVGGTKTISTDVRIVAATNRDLRQAMEKGSFREDLYYRLNVFPINMPPLRQRREDIPLLVEYFVNNAAGDLGCAKPAVGDEAMALLASYNWPGNIRELQNVVERAVLLADGTTLAPAHLPKEIVGESVAAGPDKAESSLWGYEKALIVKALRENGWNQSKAARVLGISRDNLRYRVKKFDIQKE